MPGTLVLRRLALTSALAAPLFAAAPLRAQVAVADLQEDVRGLSQRLNDLTLRVEQLEHDNQGLKARLEAGQNKDVVTAADLNAAVAQLNAAITSATDASRAEILQKVATQMESLAKQTNAALDSMSKPPAAAPRSEEPAKAAFGNSYPKDGIKYTVHEGDSIGAIARKTGAKAQDIIDANKLTDPSRIQVGQELIIPGGK